MTQRPSLPKAPGRQVALSNRVERILAWYDKHARDLPWRHTKDPYAIWVSEIMLQQTQVKTVVPYWERWMTALPDIRALAEASETQLHRLWEGLGYYRRVRHLQEAAKVIMNRHGGRFPRTYEEVLRLPGIGRYTAGAICSIAYNQPTPALDGNVTRVLTRLEGIRQPTQKRAVLDQLWSLARHLVACAETLPHRPAAGRIQRRSRHGACGELNQALMELGALVCLPHQPQCGLCPWQQDCRAYRLGKSDQWPAAVTKPAPISKRVLAVVWKYRGRVLVRQRPAHSVNGHYWEFPNQEIAEASPRARQACLAALGVTERDLGPGTLIRHAITRYRIQLEAYLVARKQPPSPLLPGTVWVPVRRVAELPFTSAHRKVARRLLLLA